MIVKKQRWVDENYAEFKDGIYVIQANQGTGKTTGLAQLKGKNVLSIGARNTLGTQTVEKHREVFETTHLRNEEGYTHSKEELQQYSSFFINLASSGKLTIPNSTHDFEYLIIDEAELVWSFSCEPEFVSFDAQQELLRRLIHTPKVILLGADFPNHLLDELKEITQHRKDRNFQHIRYDCPNLLYEKHLQWLENQNEYFSLIDEHMQRRQKAANDEWVIIDHNEPKIYSDDGRYWYGESERRQREKDIKGILIASNRGVSVLKEAENLRQKYPWATIEAIYAANQKQYEHLLESFANPEEYTGIDILIISPVFGYGIDIRNEFDLIIGDYANVPKVRPTQKEVLQALLRDRDCQNFAIYPRRINKVYPEKYVVGELNETTTFIQHLKELGIENKGFSELNPFTQEIEPRDKYVLERVIRTNAQRARDEDFCWSDLRTKWEELGGAQSQNYRGVINPKLAKKADIKLRDIPAFQNEVAARLNRAPETDKDWAEDDNGDRLDNIRRRKELAQAVEKRGLLTDKNTELHEMVNETREMFIKTTEDEYIVLLEQFRDSETWKQLLKNKDRLNKLIGDYGWYFDGQQIEIKDETELDPLKVLQMILRKYHYFTQIVAGSQKTRAKKIGKETLYNKVKKQNLKGFNQWKKTTDRTGNKRVEHYLFEGLANGDIRFEFLTRFTKEYILAFPHLLIQEYGENHV